jgi:hypothetical protein
VGLIYSKADTVLSNFYSREITKNSVVGHIQCVFLCGAASDVNVESKWAALSDRLFVYLIIVSFS